jgi:hypothetical protein
MRNITRMIELIEQARVLSMDIPDDDQNKVVDQLISQNFTEEKEALTDLLWCLSQELIALKIEYTGDSEKTQYISTNQKEDIL